MKLLIILCVNLVCSNLKMVANPAWDATLSKVLTWHEVATSIHPRRWLLTSENDPGSWCVPTLADWCWAISNGTVLIFGDDSGSPLRVKSINLPKPWRGVECAKLGRMRFDRFELSPMEYFVPPDILSLRTFCSRTLYLRTFCLGTVYRSLLWLAEPWLVRAVTESEVKEYLLLVHFRTEIWWLIWLKL